MHEQEHKLQSLLTGQNFNTKGNLNELLETAKGYTHAYAQATNGIAVLSDFQNNVNHIYSGLFGQTLGLPEYAENKDSVFEHEVFVNISDEELVERHILELRFFRFLESVPAAQKTDFNATCIVHFQRQGMPPLSVLHTLSLIHI